MQQAFQPFKWLLTVNVSLFCLQFFLNYSHRFGHANEKTFRTLNLHFTIILNVFQWHFPSKLYNVLSVWLDQLSADTCIYCNHSTWTLELARCQNMWTHFLRERTLCDWSHLKEKKSLLFFSPEHVDIGTTGNLKGVDVESDFRQN